MHAPMPVPDGTRAENPGLSCGPPLPKRPSLGMDSPSQSRGLTAYAAPHRHAKLSVRQCFHLGKYARERTTGPGDTAAQIQRNGETDGARSSVAEVRPAFGSWPRCCPAQT